MIKSFFKFLTGKSGASRGVQGSSKSTGSTGSLKDLENFVDYVVRALVDYPDSVRVSSDLEKDIKVIKIDCKKEDIGKIVGKRGKTIMAIRSLVSGAAGRLREKVSVEVVD
ncbi:MAG: KH domain-containing protein [Victivallaceae bacterium]|nr:KH domain-containing protein [Victivallaceae bacterium]NLK83701.1 KH domain-containing protein [Lentisphaerota bacterium]MDD3115997.1 KH domain-containing protein [Victivallaceae bacterium]MDD3703837.1 KH domain-containing protein [Victivallaceae bacterium]MDD4318172.1 KH domain-containing protein [Victivallaceae bacterium]